MTEEAVTWIEKFAEGKMDLDEVTLGDWVKMSLLTMFAGAELHRDMPVMYKGGLYNAHICISHARPGAAVQEQAS